MWTINDFSPGDVLLFTEKFKHGVEIRAAVVTHINFNDNGLVGYEGYYGCWAKYLPTGQGAFKPEEIGTKKFGFYKAVKKIGTGGHSFKIKE